MNTQSPKDAPRQFPSLGQFRRRIRRRRLRLSQRHRVYMSFVRIANKWHCRFHQDDLAKTPISRQFVFSSAEKIHEAARRGNALGDMESRLALDEAVATGRGGVWLHLTEDQYSALATPKP